MPDYAHVHKELQRSGVTLNLLWLEYCDQCRAAGGAICMIWAMASGLDSKLFSFSSNSAIDADPAFLRYFWMALLMRCTSSAPPGLCMI